MVAAFAAGTGPVAVDAERASGYRYGQRAYLVQLRREGAGSALIDPVGCPDLSALGEAIADAEWVLHAATQDLPCLREIGMVPTSLFDTELAGRLAGFPRVGLGAMVENVLGFALEKGHSAVDWSTRPLPEPWLRYAALDVELLVDLRDALEEELDRQGKLEWALAGVRRDRRRAARPRRARTRGAAPPACTRCAAAGRWRSCASCGRPGPGSRSAGTSPPARCSGTRRSSRRRWRCPPNVQALAALPGFGHRMGRRQLEQWQAAVDRAKALPESELPQPGQPRDRPAAAARLGRQGPGRRGPAVARRARRCRRSPSSCTCRRRT